MNVFCLYVLDGKSRIMHASNCRYLIALFDPGPANRICRVVLVVAGLHADSGGEGVFVDCEEGVTLFGYLFDCWQRCVVAGIGAHEQLLGSG